MAEYTFLVSRDPFESNDVGPIFDLATSLDQAGNRVTLFLVQNGVLAARRGADAPQLRRVAESSVEVLADDFSLRERGIAADRLATGVAAASLDVVLDHLAAGRRVVWH